MLDLWFSELFEDGNEIQQEGRACTVGLEDGNGKKLALESLGRL